MVAPRPNSTRWSDRINVDERQLIRRASWVGKHQCKRDGRVDAFFLWYSEGKKNKMDGYRVMQVGPEFIVFAGDVGVLKCQTEKDAHAAIAVARDLLENPDEWWSVLRQRLALAKSRDSQAA
jgi:hypothetical protein